MRANRLQNALVTLGDAMREVNSAIEEMRREHDPLVSHIFVSRRVYHNTSGTKSDKRRHVSAWLRRQQTCDIDFGPELETGYLYCPTPFILAGSIHEKRSQLVSRFRLPLDYNRPRSNPSLFQQGGKVFALFLHFFCNSRRVFLLERRSG